MYHGCRWVEEEIYISHDRNFQNRVHFITGYTKSSVLLYLLCLFDFNMLRYFSLIPVLQQNCFGFGFCLSVKVEVISRQNWNTLLATYLENFCKHFIFICFSINTEINSEEKILNYFYHFIMKLLLFCAIMLLYLILLVFIYIFLNCFTPNAMGSYRLKL